jgi:hypothetical protein
MPAPYNFMLIVEKIRLVPAYGTRRPQNRQTPAQGDDHAEANMWGAPKRPQRRPNPLPQALREKNADNACV